MTQQLRRARVRPALTIALAGVLAGGLFAAPVAAAAGNEVLVGPASAGYRYQQVSQGHGAGFESPSFDDAAFADGTGMFGTENGCARDGDLHTEWAPLTDLLVRRTVAVPDDGRRLHLAVAVSGAAQVFVNGTEVTDGLVPGSEDCPGRDDIHLIVPEAALIRGADNLIAVRARSLPTSAYFDLQAVLVPVLSNDGVADATVVTAVPFTEQLSMLGGTVEDGEPIDVCPSTDWGACSTAWYRFSPTEPGRYVIEAEIPGDDESVPQGIAVYTGAPFDGLTLVTSRTYYDWGPRLIVAGAGAEYLVQVAGPVRLGDEVVVTIEPAPDPTAAINAWPRENLTTATRIHFWSEVNDPAHQQVASYAWDFGDGGTSSEESAQHYFKQPGTYTVTLTATMVDGRIATTSTELTIALFEGVPPTASFTWAPDAPDTLTDVQFASVVDDPSFIGFETIRWTFGDGSEAEGQDAWHRFAAEGDYLVELEARTWDGRVATASGTVTVTKAVLADPVAAFGMWPDQPFAGQEVTFSDQSYDPAWQGIASIEWDFGDGETASAGWLTHRFAAAGTYTVTLTATTTDGRSDTETREVTVSPPPPPDVYVYWWPGDPTTFDTVQFNGWAYDPVGSAIDSYAWDFGDGAGSTDQYPTHRYAADGTYRVTLTARTADGRHATASVDITVASHDVAIVKVTAAKSASAGQTKAISAEITSRRSTETVLVQFYRGTPQGYVFVTEQRVTVKRDKTLKVSMDYLFTEEDASYGRLTFKVTATIDGWRDALPADNEAISAPTKIAK